jgi:GNAT superfamily N-acetyltransferase
MPGRRERSAIFRIYSSTAPFGARGCGRRLIEAVAAVARERGCYRLYWTTKEDNATARSLYDRIARFNGFIRYDYALE